MSLRKVRVRVCSVLMLNITQVTKSSVKGCSLYVGFANNLRVNQNKQTFKFTLNVDIFIAIWRFIFSMAYIDAWGFEGLDNEKTQITIWIWRFIINLKLYLPGTYIYCDYNEFVIRTCINIIYFISKYYQCLVHRIHQ